MGCGGRSAMLLEKIRTERGAFATVSAFVAMAVGMGLLGASSEVEHLWAVLVMAIVGLVLVAVALLWTHDRLDGRLSGSRTRWAFPLGLVVASGLLGAAMWLNWEWLGLVAIAAGAAAAMGTHTVLRELVPGRIGGRSVARTLWLPAELVFGGLGAVWALDRFTVLAWAGLLAAMFGTLLLKQQMAELLYTNRVGRRRAIRISADVAVVGVLLLLGGASTSSQLAVLFGAALAFCGLSVLGLALVYVAMSTRTAVLVVLGGLVLIGLGWLAARVSLGVPGWASMLTTLVVVVGAWFVFRGEAIIAVVIIGFVAVWGMADGYTSLPVDPHPAGEVRLLALGDSFISGEGADDYFPGTNQLGADRNECRRSPTAYPYLIAESAGYSLDFLACSGAKAEDLIECGQMATDEPRCRPVGEWRAQPPLPVDALAGVRPQLAHLGAERLAEADVVLLSIGGNDVGFSTIVKACLLPRSCAERSEEWLGNVDALGPTLVEAYEAVRGVVAPGVPVIVVPYPLVVDLDDRCDAGLDRSEYEFIAEFTERLDEVITQSASEAGVAVWPEGRDVYAGRRLCDDDPAVNHLDVDPPNGSPLRRYLPGAWVHNSMHPKPSGHALVAAGLGPFVAAALETPPPVPPPSTSPDAPATEPAEVTPSDSADSAVADDLLTDGEWITDELYRTIRSLLLPVVLLLVGSLTLAVGLSNLAPFELLRPRRGWWKWREDDLAARAAAEGPDGLAAAS